MPGREPVLQPLGMWVDPSPYSAVPPGALKDARNVVIPRQGLVAPRPGFANAIGWVPPNGHIPYRLVPFNGAVLIFSKDGGGTWKTLRASNGSEITGYSGAASGVSVHHAEARASLYVTSSKGVYKLTSASASAWKRAGTWQALSGALTALSSAAGVWLPADFKVAYRAVVRAEDANGYIVRGAPSGRWVVHNTDASSRFPQLILPVPSYAVEGEVIELYRSLAVEHPIEADDEMALAYEHTLTSTDLTNGYVLIDDTTAEDLLGAALYSAPSQGGAESEKHRPPLAKVIAAFAGMLFYGDVVGPQRTKTLRITYDAANSDTLWGYTPNLRGTFTIGSNVITAVNAADIPYVAVGQRIRDAAHLEWNTNGTFIPANTTVTAVNRGAQTVTMSANALASGTPAQAFDVGDVLTIRGKEYVASDENTVAIGAVPVEFQARTGLGQDTIRTCLENLAFQVGLEDQGALVAVVTGIDGEAATADVASITFEAAALDAPAFTAIVTHPEAFTPRQATGVQTTVTYTSSAESRPGRVCHSALDEPEAVPLLNYDDVGSQRARVLWMRATRDVLLVGKEDGIYRISGYSPESLRVDALDAGAVPVHVDAAIAFNDGAYAWTRRGIVAITDAGVELLSKPAIQHHLDGLQDAIARAPDAQGVFMLGSQDRDLVLLGIPNSTSAGRSNYRVWCLNTKTAAWTYWEREWRDAIFNPADGYIWAIRYGTGTEYAISTERTTSHAFDSDTGANIAFESEIAFVAKAGGDPLTEKLWTDMRLLWEQLSLVLGIEIAFTSDWYLQAETSVAFQPQLTDWPHPMKCQVPRAHARSALLFPTIRITGSNVVGDPIGGGYPAYAWLFAGISLGLEAPSARLRADR